jgi:serine/threonine-protein kinase RsbW
MSEPASLATMTQATGPICLTERFRSGDANTRDALSRICAGLKRANLDQADIENAEIVLAEVLNNVTEHAYRGSEGVVEVALVLRHAEVLCTIRDQGNAMPGDPPRGRPVQPETALESLPEGGFGWHIIRCLTRDLTCERREEWNVLRFALPLGSFQE